MTNLLKILMLLIVLLSCKTPGRGLSRALETDNDVNSYVRPKPLPYKCVLTIVREGQPNEEVVLDVKESDYKPLRASPHILEVVKYPEDINHQFQFEVDIWIGFGAPNSTGNFNKDSIQIFLWKLNPEGQGHFMLANARADYGTKELYVGTGWQGEDWPAWLRASCLQLATDNTTPIPSKAENRVP
jgi:hypothetical protein